jgi:phosphatidylglycerophosphate synthase
MGLSLAHFLSLARVLLAVPVAFALAPAATSSWFLPVVALACVTDFADGRIARARGVQSGTGRWLDAGADVVFLVATFHALGEIGLWVTAGDLVGGGPSPALNRAPLWALVLSFGSFVARAALAATLARPLAASPLGRVAGVLNYGLALVGGVAMFPGIDVPGSVRLAAMLLVVAANLAAAGQNFLLTVRVFASAK